MKEDLLVDRIVKRLQVPQKVYREPTYEPIDLSFYDVEFEYFGRCLHQLGKLFQEMKIMDLTEPTFENAVMYCLSGGNIEVGIAHKNFQEICDLLGINILVMGPDEEQKYFWYGETVVAPEPWIMLYQSYDGLFYPIISLMKKETYLFYRQNNNILQQLVPEPTKLN